MFQSIDGFGRVFLMAIYLVICAVVTSQIIYGTNQRKAKEIFIILFLILIVGIQYFYLIEVANFVPATRFYTWDVSVFTVSSDFISSYLGE